MIDFAELIGKHRNTVGAWVREGLPIVPGGGRPPKVDVRAALQWLLARVEANAEERLTAARANPRAEAAREQKLVAEARLAELDVAEREGTLVPADQVGERWGRMTLAMRERVLALPASAVQAGLAHPDSEKALGELVADALRELAARGAA